MAVALKKQKNLIYILGVVVEQSCGRGGPSLEISVESDEFAESLCSKLDALLTHSFIAKQQSQLLSPGQSLTVHIEVECSISHSSSIASIAITEKVLT